MYISRGFPAVGKHDEIFYAFEEQYSLADVSLGFALIFTVWKSAHIPFYQIKQINIRC